MNPYKTLIVLAFLLSCAAPQHRAGTGAQEKGAFDVRDGKIVRKSDADAGHVRVDGTVAHIYQDGTELYYLAGRGGGEPPSRAGYRDTAAGISHEGELPVPLQGKTVLRFLGARGVVFILTCEGAARDAACLLHRIELNTMKEKRIEGVHDVVLWRAKPVLLERRGGVLAVNSNGATVPVNIAGGARFGGILEDRFVTVKAGTESEMVDLALMRSIHAWSSSGNYMAAGEHNLALETLDAGGAPSEKMLFYKVFVDGKYSGRTTTGPAQQAQRGMVRVDENEWHIIRVERWELHEGQGKYLRVNNIEQPRPLRVYMPSNRVLKLAITREGGRYNVRRSMMKEEEKEPKR